MGGCRCGGGPQRLWQTGRPELGWLYIPAYHTIERYNQPAARGAARLPTAEHSICGRDPAHVPHSGWLYIPPGALPLLALFCCCPLFLDSLLKSEHDGLEAFFACYLCFGERGPRQMGLEVEGARLPPHCSQSLSLPSGADCDAVATFWLAWGTRRNAQRVIKMKRNSTMHAPTLMPR